MLIPFIFLNLSVFDQRDFAVLNKIKPPHMERFGFKIQSWVLDYSAPIISHLIWLGKSLPIPSRSCNCKNTPPFGLNIATILSGNQFPAQDIENDPKSSGMSFLSAKISSFGPVKAKAT